MTDTPLSELVRSLLPVGAIPDHLDPADVLDADFEPDPSVAPAVFALRELASQARRFDERGPRLSSSRDAARFFTSRFGGDRTESIAIVGLDAKLNVMFHRVVARGGVASCPVRIADLLRPIILNAAHSALLVHNHPSGDPKPSIEDIELTRQVRLACQHLGIGLVDHLIVARDGHFSFLDAGLIPSGG